MSQLCETSRTIAAGVLSSTTTTTYTKPVAFSDHLNCLSRTQSLSATGPNGFHHELEIVRDAQGRVTEFKQGPVGSPTILQTLTYGSHGRLASIDNAASGVTSLVYDSLYRLTKVISPDTTENEVASFDTRNDQPTTLQQHRGTQFFDSEFRFDGYGRLQKSWDSFGGYSESSPQVSLDYRFATSTHPAKIFQDTQIEKTSGIYAQSQSVFLQTGRGRDLAGFTESANDYRVSGLTEFDHPNLLTKIYQDHLVPATTDFEALTVADLDYAQSVLGIEERDFLGTLVEQEEGIESGVSKTTDYDYLVEADRTALVSQVNQDALLETTVWRDPLGNIVQYRDQAGSDYFYERDALGRIRKITFPDGIVQTAAYEDRFGKISEIERDHVGRLTYSYDVLTGRLAAKEIFDKNGVRNRRIEFSYDSAGRLSLKSMKLYDGAGVLIDSVDYDYKYDGTNLDVADQPGQTGFLTGVESTKFSKKTVYRLDGKILKQELLVPNQARLLMTYDYMAHGELKSKRQQVFLDPSGTETVNYLLTYEYDRFGNVIDIKKDGAAFIGLTYDAMNLLSNASLQGGKSLSLAYDPLTLKLKDHTEQNSGVVTFRQLVNWNARGLIENSDFEMSGRLVTNAYTYNNLGFLASQSQTDSGGTAESHVYGHDEGSASIYYGTVTSSSVNGTSKNIAIGASSWTVDGVSYDLDALGRVTSRGPKSFSYGPNGRIASVTQAGSALADYFYDEENNPILKEISGGGAEIYLGDSIWSSGTFLEPVQIGTRMVGYFKNGTFTSTAQDHLNSFVVDETGTYKKASPYGVRAGNSEEVSSVANFALKGYDSDIESVRMGRRYYDPKAKRFLTPDGLFFEDPDKIVESPVEGVLYGYVGNDPINHIDPSGNGKIGALIKITKSGMKHITERHIKGEGTKFRNPKRIIKDIKDVVKRPDRVVKQGDGRLRYEKARNRPVGKGGERVQSVVTEADGRLVTSHPRDGFKQLGKHDSVLKGPGALIKGNAVAPVSIPGANLGKDIFGDNIVGEAAQLFNPISDVQDVINFVRGAEVE